ncbi:MAG TPA: response regulator [Verrucomicrobiae bacterium]|jgi:CheY-like chemotaxis protein
MKKTILIVDDDASVRESVEKVLRSAGYETLLTAGGADAITRFPIGSIDLVVMDIGLPNRDGWESCKQVVRVHSNVPIIVITGHAGQFTTALGAGASACMEKPFDAQELLQTVQELLAPKEVAAPAPSAKGISGASRRVSAASPL